MKVFNSILLSLTISTLALAQETVGSDTITLQPSWNLMGASQIIDVASTFTDPSVNIVWTFDDTTKTWKAYSSDATTQATLESSNLSGLTQIEAGQGYWALNSSDSNVSLTVNASSQNETITTEELDNVIMDLAYLGITTLAGNTPNASIYMGVTQDGGQTWINGGTFSSTDTISTYTLINVDPSHVGSEIGIVEVVGINAGSITNWFMHTSSNTWELWDGTVENLAVSQSFSSAPEQISFKNFEGIENLTEGTYSFYIGYQTTDGEFLYNTTGFNFIIE